MTDPTGGYVYLSYSRDDMRFAGRLSHELTARGIRMEMDLRRRVELAVPQYSTVANILTLTPGRLVDNFYANELTVKVQDFLATLRATFPVGDARAPIVDDPGTTLSDATLVTVLNAGSVTCPGRLVVCCSGASTATRLP